MQNKNEMIFGETQFQDISIALLRIFFGTSILIHGVYKAGDLYFFSHLVNYMGHPVAGFMAPILAYGQILIGLSLVLGLFTRFSALITFIATAYTMLIIYNLEPLYNKELAVAYFFISLVFFFRGGAKYSLDDKFRQHFVSAIKKDKFYKI
jgi:putative oxidoreductase